MKPIKKGDKAERIAHPRPELVPYGSVKRPAGAAYRNMMRGDPLVAAAAVKVRKSCVTYHIAGHYIVFSAARGRGPIDDSRNACTCIHYGSQCMRDRLPYVS